MRTLFTQLLLASVVALPLATFSNTASLQKAIAQEIAQEKVQAANFEAVDVDAADIETVEHEATDTTTEDRPETAHSCYSETHAEPANDQRVIEIPDWQVSFAIPENYQMLRSGSIVDVLAPSSYAQTQCMFTPHPAQNIEPYGVSVALIDRAITEEDIRAQLSTEKGTYLGATGMPSGIAYMHTTRNEHDLVHLSLPVPGKAATIVFTANTDSSGEIFQEEVLETILGSFAFETY